MVRELEIRHADLYHTISKEAFQKAVEELSKKIPQLDDDEIILEFAKLTALIGDGHTGLFLPWARGFDFHKLPLDLFYDGEKYFILAASLDYKNLVGAEILKVGGFKTEVVIKKITPLLPVDNSFSLKPFAGNYLMLTELLETLEIIENSEQVPLTLEFQDGSVKVVNVNPVPRNVQIDWQYITDKPQLPLFIRHRNQQYWFEYLPEDLSIYLQFNSADIGSGAQENAFVRFTDSLVELITKKKPERLIIDLRWNSGGSFLRTRHLLWAVIRAEKINEEGKLFTIIGPGTFSAATALATELDWHTNTIFVGDPTGGRPNSFGDLGRITLPNAQIEIWYSRWAMNQSSPGDNRPAIFPDLKAPLKLKAYRQNVDPALKVIKQYEVRKSIAPVIKSTIVKEGVKKAVEQYWELYESAYNQYDFSEHQLNTLGHQLLQKDSVEAAIAVFSINKQVYPYSANSYDSLGDGYRALGNKEKAIELYQKAFEMNKQYSHSRDNILELQEKD